MKTYRVLGYGVFSGIDVTIAASSPKVALNKVLASSGVSYSQAVKLTAQKNEELLSKNLDPSNFISFTVTMLGSSNPIIGTSNWCVR